MNIPADIQNPAPVPTPSTPMDWSPLNPILQYMTWVGIAGAVLSIIVIGVHLANVLDPNSTAKVSKELLAVVAGLALISSAMTVVGALA